MLYAGREGTLSPVRVLYDIEDEESENVIPHFRSWHVPQRSQKDMICWQHVPQRSQKDMIRWQHVPQRSQKDMIRWKDVPQRS